ncbi:MAG TPA: hypothetical protein VLC91_14620 [Spongiibacteraceae bacterium]|nr:hypothetical protein [Spongiibacteraceae bacterium]
MLANTAVFTEGEKFLEICSISQGLTAVPQVVKAGLDVCIGCKNADDASKNLFGESIR